MLNLPGAGIHWMGDSTIGKTTALALGASVWGDEEYVRGWRNTANGLEGAAEQHSDTLLALDEIREINPHELYQVVDFLINGRGKGRANRFSEGVPLKRWRVALLSAGENSIQAHLAEAGIAIKDGQALRILDVPVSGKYGLFDDLHDAGSPAEFSDTLRRNANKHFGYAGPEFVKSIIGKSGADFSKKLTQILEQFGVSAAQELRGARTFALAALAGELAIEAGILPWEKDTLTTAAKTVFERWRDARSINAPGTTYRKVLDAVAAFINTHGESRFSPLDQDKYNDQVTRTINRAWFRSREGFYCFTGPGLKDATRGIDFDQVLDALDQAEAFVKKGGKQRSVTTRTPDVGTPKLYWINPTKLNL
jgi:putative DNA primase/helicase